MAQTTSLVFNGGSIPSPAPAPTGSGKAKLLKIGEITITEQGVQVTKKVICDPDSVTTAAPFMEVLTSAKLAELVEANSIIVLDDGDMQYLMANANITVEEGIPVCTAVNFLGLSQDKRAKVAYNCTRITDELTLQQVVEVGEPVETDFNLVIADSEDTAPNTLIDKLEVVDTVRDPEDPEDPPLLSLETTVDGQGNRKVAINEDNLRTFVKEVDDAFEDVWDSIGELPNDEHGYFNSSLYQTPGDGTTESLLMDNFRISQGRDVHGDSIEFVPTHQEDGVDFGEVYLNPGTYILNVHYTLQYVGNPRGTFHPLVTNVGEQPFDFSYEHEDILRTTRIVTRTTRGKFGLAFPFDKDTPPMGIWVKYLEIAQIASYNHPAVTHDSTLAGSGQIGDPLGVTTDVFGKVKDIPTSISQFRTGDVIPVDGPSGPAKMLKDDLLTETAQNALAGNVAPEFVPDSTNAVAGMLYMYSGKLCVAKEDYSGSWDAGKFKQIALVDYLARNSYLSANMKLTRGAVDGTGTPTSNNPTKRLHSELFTAAAPVVTMDVNTGYTFYYYIYDSSGTYISKHETGYTSDSIPITIGYKIRFVFRTAADTDIGDFENIISSCSGFFSADYNYGLDILGLHNALGTVPNSAALLFALNSEIKNKKTYKPGTIASFDTWEPSSVPSQYETPNDRSQVTCSLSYYGFLTKYYDSLLSDVVSEDYIVKRRSLGRDSSGNYDIFEYDFCPKNYTETVLLNAGMNALELTAEFGLAIFLNNVVLNYDSDPGLKYIHDNVRIKVIPILCPWSFDQPILQYGNYNGVNINRNFDYKGEWANIESTQGTWNYKGESPESEVETRVLRTWVQENASVAKFHIDCHTDVGNSTQQTFLTIASDWEMQQNVLAAQTKIIALLTAQGYLPTSAQCSTAVATVYPKMLIFDQFDKVHSMMIEQIEGDLTHGGNGNACSAGNIKNYCTMIYCYFLANVMSETKLYDVIENENSVASCMLIARETKSYAVDFFLGGVRNGTFNLAANNARRRRNFKCIGSHRVKILLKDSYTVVDIFEKQTDGTVISHNYDGATTDPQLYNFVTSSSCEAITVSLKNSSNTDLSLAHVSRADYEISIDGYCIDFDLRYAGIRNDGLIFSEANFTRILFEKDVADCSELYIAIKTGYSIVDTISKTGATFGVKSRKTVGTIGGYTVYEVNVDGNDKLFISMKKGENENMYAETFLLDKPVFFYAK